MSKPTKSEIRSPKSEPRVPLSLAREVIRGEHINALNAEAGRFKQLSREQAHLAMFSPTPDARQRYEKLAREHDLRADTYKQAAALIGASA